MTRAEARADASYSEDRSAIRWPSYFWISFWGVLLAAFIVAGIVTGSPNLAVLMALAFVGVLLTVGFTIKNWPVGIRINRDGIRIGAVRRRPLPSGKRPWSDYQRWHELAVPWDAVRRAAVITDKPGLRDARRLNKRDITEIGVLTAPFTRAVLLIEIDPGRVVIPDFREPDTERQLWRYSHTTPFELSAVWCVSTRHPGRLRAVLAQHAAAFGDSTSSDVPAYVRLLLERGDVTSQPASV